MLCIFYARCCMRVTSAFLDRAILGLKKNEVWIACDKKFIVVKKDCRLIRIIKKIFSSFFQTDSSFDSKMVFEKIKSADWSHIDKAKKNTFFRLFDIATKGKYSGDIHTYLEAPILRDQKKVDEVFRFITDYGQRGYVNNLGVICRIIQREGKACLRVQIDQEVVILGRQPITLFLERGDSISYKDLQTVLDEIYRLSIIEKSCAEEFNSHVTCSMRNEMRGDSFLLSKYLSQIMQVIEEGRCVKNISIERYKCLVRKVSDRHLIIEMKWKNQFHNRSLLTRDELWSMDVSFPLNPKENEKPVIFFSSKYERDKPCEVPSILEEIAKSLSEKVN